MSATFRSSCTERRSGKTARDAAGFYFAPGSDIGGAYQQEKNQQYVVVKPCLPTGKQPTTVIDRDAATKGTVSQHEIDNYYLAENVALNINVPVFLLNGDLDGILCHQNPVDVGTDCSSAARIVEQEKPFLPGAPSIDINAFRAAPIAFKSAMRWVVGKVPPR